MTPITQTEPKLGLNDQDEWVSPFGNLRVKGCSHLTAAYRSVPRPSSPVCAKASTNCPYLTLESPHHQRQRRTDPKADQLGRAASRGCYQLVVDTREACRRTAQRMWMINLSQMLCATQTRNASNHPAGSQGAQGTQTNRSRDPHRSKPMPPRHRS